MEPKENSMNPVEINPQAPEKQIFSSKEKDKFDAVGQPRKVHVFENGETFYGSEQEFSDALSSYHENKEKLS